MCGRAIALENCIFFPGAAVVILRKATRGVPPNARDVRTPLGLIAHAHAPSTSQGRTNPSVRKPGRSRVLLGRWPHPAVNSAKEHANERTRKSTARKYHEVRDMYLLGLPPVVVESMEGGFARRTGRTVAATPSAVCPTGRSVTGRWDAVPRRDKRIPAIALDRYGRQPAGTRS